MANRYNLISIDSIYLTSDGTALGTPCKTKVSGLNSAQLEKSGTVIPASDGTMYVQLIDNKGVNISIELDWITKAVFDSLIALFNSVISEGNAFSLNISGDTGTFAFNSVPAFPDPVEFSGDFSDGILKNVTFKFITT